MAARECAVFRVQGNHQSNSSIVAAREWLLADEGLMTEVTRMPVSWRADVGLLVTGTETAPQPISSRQLTRREMK
jgi:hypothetical protein